MKINKKLLPLILLIILQPFFIIILNIANLNSEAYPLGTIAENSFVRGILSVIITAAAIVLIKKIVKQVEKETEMRVQLENFENVQEMVHTIRSQRHDFNNHLQIIHGLLSVGAYEKAKKYMSEVNAPIQFSNRIFSDNLSITALLQVKANRAESKDITTDFVVDGSLKDSLIPIRDLNTVIGNLLDNAIEAANETDAKEKTVKMSIVSTEDKLLITVSNTGYQLAENIKTHIYNPGFTTKLQGEGMGLWSVKKIVDKYSGSINVENEDNGIKFEIVFTK